ncbi:MAG: hypothetical protein NVS3B1_07830 [Marmoricola sp.]
MSDTGLGDQSAVPADDGEAYASFLSSDMLEAMALLGQLAYEAGVLAPENTALLRVMLHELEVELRELARVTAVRSVEYIRSELDGTQKRPDNQAAHHLRDLIVSTPSGSTGVKIALLAELDKAVNAQGGYGPYWRAIEYGSEAVGNIMTGRVLFGRFVGPGHDDAPRSEYGGADHAPGSEFIFGSEAAGGAAGFGTVAHEIEPRYFLRKGTEHAAIGYGFGIRDLSRKYARRILALTA